MRGPINFILNQSFRVTFRRHERLFNQNANCLRNDARAEGSVRVRAAAQDRATAIGRHQERAASSSPLRSSVDSGSVLEHPQTRLESEKGAIDDVYDEKENFCQNPFAYDYKDGTAYHTSRGNDLARSLKSPPKSFSRQTTHSMELLTCLSESDDDSCSKNTGEESIPAPSDGESIQDTTRKALVWMQRDGENQAKENRVMQEHLHGIILLLNGAIRDLMPTNAALYHHAAQVQQWKHLSLDKVEELVNEWEDVIAEWKYAAFEEEKERNEVYGLSQEDCDARVQLLMHSHALERMICEDYASARSQSKTATTSKSTPTNTNIPEDDTNARVIAERRTMDLQAGAKEAELHALHWQMAYEDQSACFRQLDERLGMSIEESPSMHDELRHQQRDLSKMIHVDTLKIYQQKIAFLEDQVHDAKQQIACDHEEFLYEQTKWKLEKKHLGKEVEEIQDVSVKVLRLLLIREKLLKKQERAHTKRVASWHNHCGSLKTLTAKLMQECTLILVVLREHAITISNLGNSKLTAQIFPVKPVQIKKMIKRLKIMDQALEQLAAADDAERSCCSPSDEADHLLSDDVATSVSEG